MQFWKRQKKDNTHHHVLKAMDVSHPARTPFQPAFTIVLFGCENCTHVETVSLDGTWSMEQVTYLHPHNGVWEEKKNGGNS